MYNKNSNKISQTNQIRIQNTIIPPKKRGLKYKQAKKTHTQKKKLESSMIGITYHNQAKNSEQQYKM